jgi:hypothetical protein
MQSQYAAGLIFEGILTGAISAVPGNWAIWGLSSATARANSFYTTGVNSVSSRHTWAWRRQTLPAIRFQRLWPIWSFHGGGRSCKWIGPQEFIGVVPEPGTLALFGSGLAMLGGALRKGLAGSRS